MLARLDQKMDDKIGGDYGQLVLKLDLLGLAKKPGGCHASSLYTALEQEPMTRQLYMQKLSELEEAIDRISSPTAIVQAEIYRHAQARMQQAQSIMRQVQLKPDDFHTSMRGSGGPTGGPFVSAQTQSFGGDESDILSSFARVSNEEALAVQLQTLNRLQAVTGALPLSTPLPDAVKTSGFSIRRDPFNGRTARHEGVDLVGEENAKVYSAAPGIVKIASRYGSYGNLVEIDHGFGITTRYAHLKKIMVRKGDEVGVEQLIGIQGETGRATGPHLHYEVRVNNYPRDPERFMQLGGQCGPV